MVTPEERLQLLDQAASITDLPNFGISDVDLDRPELPEETRARLLQEAEAQALFQSRQAERSIVDKGIESAQGFGRAIGANFEDLLKRPFAGQAAATSILTEEAERGLPRGSLAIPAVVASAGIDAIDTTFRVFQATFGTVFAVIEELGTQLSGDADTGRNIREAVETSLVFLGAAGGGGRGPVRARIDPSLKRSKRRKLEEVQGERPLATLAKAEQDIAILSDSQLNAIARGRGKQRELALDEKVSRFKEDSPVNKLPTEAEVETAFQATLEAAFKDAPNKELLVEEQIGLFKKGRDAAKKELLGDAAEQVGKSVTELSRDAEGVIVELLSAEGFQYNPNRGLLDQLNGLVQADRLSAAKLNDALARVGVKGDEFLNGIRVEASEAGRLQQTLSVASRQIKQIQAMDRTRKATSLMGEITDKGLGLSSMGRLKGISQGTLTLSRAFFVSPLSTAMRNAGSVIGIRLPLDAMIKTMDNGIRAMFHSPEIREANHIQALGPVVNLFTRNPVKNHALSNSILNRFPKQHDEMFLRFSSDIELSKSGGAVLERVNKIASIVNIFNRTQDIVIRNAIFLSRMNDMLKAKGTSVEAINAEALARNVRITELLDSGVPRSQAFIRAGREFNKEFSKVTKRMVNKSVNDALDMTFAKNYTKGKSYSQTIGANFIDFINSLGPVGIQIQAFPRFLVNSLEFTLDNMGGTMFKLLKKKEWVQVKAGNVDAISKAVSSIAILGGIVMLHNKFNKGNKPYELELEDGTIFDTRSIPPLAGLLTLVDLRKRIKEERLNDTNFVDFFEGFANSKIEGDNFISAFTTGFNSLKSVASDPERFETAIRKAVGGQLAPIGALLKTLQDIASFIDEDELTLRSKSEDQLFGPITSRVPGVSQTLPEVQSPTREGALRRARSPIDSLVGIPFRDPKNLFEKHLDRLNIAPRNVRFNTTDDLLDDALNEHLGFYVENVVIPTIETIDFDRMDNNIAVEAFRGLLSKAREQAKIRLAHSDNDEAKQRLFRDVFRRLPSNQRRILAKARPEKVREILVLAIDLGVEDLQSETLSPSMKATFENELEKIDPTDPPF